MSRCKHTRAVLLMNYLLCLNAYPQINNRFKTQIQNKWNGFWVMRFAQMLNLGAEKNLLSASFMVSSVTLTTQCPQQKDFSEYIRGELVDVLTGGAISANLLAVAQTALDLLNAPGDAALGKVGYKYINPIDWYQKGEKVTDWALKTDQFKKSLEKNITYGIFFVAGNPQNNAVEAFTELF